MPQKGLAGSPKSPSGSWLKSLPEKFLVAAATALGTWSITIGLPSLKDSVFKSTNRTTLSEQSVAFQRQMWTRNENCPVDPTVAIWHDSDQGRKIDATICPDTGDIAVTMRGMQGRIVQGFIDLSDIEGQFDNPQQPANAQLSDLFVGTAQAAIRRALPAPGQSAGREQMAQAVMCQLFLPDGRSLRRRLVIAPNQCVEIMIDTYTGQVKYKRSIPCIRNCGVNV